MTSAERDALLARIDERTLVIAASLEKVNGRVSKVELRELACPTDLPKRVDDLETRAAQVDGVLNAVRWISGSGGIAGILALVDRILAMAK